MSAVNDGGPVHSCEFACMETGGVVIQHLGESLLDKLAGLAMPEIQREVARSVISIEAQIQIVAARSYAQAKAMIAERERILLGAK